jgi:alpha-L-fucosidase
VDGSYYSNQYTQQYPLLIQKLEDKPGVWKYFEVIFNKRIKKGETININYKWPTIDDCKSSSPFISTLTDVPTKKLIFKINLGQKYAGNIVYMEERRSIDGDNMLDRNEYSLDHNGCVTIPISPHRFRYFIVFWKW